METKYTFRDFLNILQTESIRIRDKQCVDKEVINAINEALPKKYCVVEVETATDLDFENQSLMEQIEQILRYTESDATQTLIPDARLRLLRKTFNRAANDGFNIVVNPQCMPHGGYNGGK